MKPSVGRIVLYGVGNNEFPNNQGNVAPAIITRVWSDTCVNLRVLCDGPDVAWKTSVVLDETPDATEPKDYGWIWPPRV